nr:MAG TPA: hypothetical protein [Caudoviricetes sp.]
MLINILYLGNWVGDFFILKKQYLVATAKSASPEYLYNALLYDTESCPG